MTETEDGAMTSGRQGQLTHTEWMITAEREYQRLHDLLVATTPDGWHAPTDCDEWDVREIVSHLVGAAHGTASLRELRRQQKLGQPLRPGVDGINDIQVLERADTSPDQLISDLGDAAERGVRARRRIPVALRVLRVPFGPPLGVRSVGYLMDRVYTRDAWMHRIDISRATGHPILLTADHDGRLVDDVVREWAHAHRQPFSLTLTGPAGGEWSSGIGGQQLTLDAVQFCRVLSGRETGESLLAEQVPF